MTRERAYKLRELIVKAAGSLADKDAVEGVELFAPWEVDTEYVTGDRRRRADRLYKCRQGHTAHAGWEPENAPALWEEIADPSIEWPEWKQPTGAHDAYKNGAKVSHNGKHWINTYGDGNNWEPGVCGWDLE